MKLPVVEANFALSLDGKVSTRTSAPTGFTSARDKRRLLEIRARGDALLVGRRTLLIDNMSMGLPAPDLREQRLRAGLTAEPLRVIISARGRLPKNAKVFRSPGAPIVVFTTGAMPAATRRWLDRIADVRVAEGRREVDLPRALEVLAREYGVRTAVCEGGPSLLHGLVAAGLLHRLHITLAPLLFGGATAPTLLGPAAAACLPQSVPLRLESLTVEHGEAYASYVVKKTRR
jgi:2,5-diamino-6-(ribosylamino)-4(3H)-pyrimidinone 5'-phosphate reductase